MRMGDRSSKLAGLGIICVLAVSLPDSASDKRPSSMASDERAIRSLISNWVEAYEDLDAKRLAALETPEVQVVDRFGVLHLGQDEVSTVHNVWMVAAHNAQAKKL